MRLIVTVRELTRSYDKPRADRCYVAWSTRDLGLRPKQRKMAMTGEVGAMIKDLALTRTRERLASCDAEHYLNAAKTLIRLIAMRHSDGQ